MSMKKEILLAVMSVCLSFGTAMAEEAKEMISGIYNGHQLIPNEMATICQTSAEDMVKDPDKLYNCINRLALKRRSSDAETAREGLEELNTIKTEQLQKMLGLAVAKGAAVADYYAKTSEQVSEANKDAKTVNDVDGAAVNTNAVLTSVVNSFRDLYVEQLKYLAISNIENIDKSVLLDIASLSELENAQAEADAKADAQNNSASSGQYDTTSFTKATTTDVELPHEWQYVKEGVCKLCVKKENNEIECREETCPDGEYKDTSNPNIGYICKGGDCQKVDITSEGE